MSISAKISRFALPASFLLGLSGCASLPSAGPSAGAIGHAKDVDVVRVTPDYASAMAVQVKHEEADELQRSLIKLADTPPVSQIRFAPGDTLHVNLLTISPWSGSSGGGMNLTPRQIDLGKYTVSPNGTIDLPYAGRVKVSRLTVSEAQEELSSRFAGLGIMQNPAIKVDALSVPQGGIIVTGAIGAPKTIQWNAAGMTLAEALTQAMGNGVDLLSNKDGGLNQSATEVSIYRGNTVPVRLPMAAALEHMIELEPGDRIVVTHAPAVRIAVLGGGVSKDGEYNYASPPTLDQVLAQASGLNSNTANDHAIFILRRNTNGKKPTVYDFAWNKVDGLVAAQNFPLENGDVVYVAEAPIVSVQKAIGILFQLALPAQVLKL